jgi:phage terminase Nu1 subunit (DNA packaging protein)
MAMPESDNINIEPQKTDVIAKLFGITVRRVQQLTQEGIINTIKVGKANRYDLFQTVQHYIIYLQHKITSKEASYLKLEADKLAAETSIKQSKARIAELELEELEGKMHRSEDVEALITDLVFNIRSMIMALPGRLAVDMANIKSASEASERVKQEVYSILNDLSNYRYDPEEYKRRVRDREGWQGMGDDGPDN